MNTLLPAPRRRRIPDGFLCVILPVVMFIGSEYWVGKRFLGVVATFLDQLHDTYYSSDDKVTATMMPIQYDSSQDLRNASIAILDLFPWEVASIPTPETGPGICQPPTRNRTVQHQLAFNVPKICCVASLYSLLDNKKNERLGSQCRGMDNAKLRDHVSSVLDDEDSSAPDSGCDACRIIHLAMDHNLNISFWGDSITSQSYEGFLCELYRRDYRVAGSTTLEPRQKALKLLHAVTTTTVTHPYRTDRATVTIRNFFQWRPQDIAEKMYQNVLGEIMHTTDVLVFNFGLHYTLEMRDTFDEKMGRFFDILRHYNHGNFTLLAYRESTAQHFDSPDGDYYYQRNPNTTQCLPIRGGPNVGWREPIVKERATNAGFRVIRIDGPSIMALPREHPQNIMTPAPPEMVVLPFFNFTVPHHDLHPIEAGRNGEPDCTHFCSTPYLWLPVWRSLRLALERRLA